MRTRIKSLLERVLRRSVGNPARMRGRSLVLAYHNVVPDGFQELGDRSLHLSFSSFRRQLDLLQAHCRLTSLPDLLDQRPPPERLSVAITFDDAYAGAVELALPELARRGLPGTLFVAPGLLGAPSFWWDELAHASGGLSESVRKMALDTHGGSSDRIRAALGERGSATRLPEWYRCAEMEAVLALGHSGDLALGAHSWTHPNLTCLSHAELTTELTRPLEWLQATHGRTLRVLAYPYGIHSAEVRTAAQTAGYDAALRVEGGWLQRVAGDRYAVPRYNVPAGLSEDGFVLRLAGVVPL